MKQNAFFDEMYRIGHEWSEKHAAHQKLKEEITRQKLRLENHVLMKHPYGRK